MTPRKIIKISWLVGMLLIGPAAWAGSGTPATNAVAVLDFKVENPTANAGERVAGLEDFFEVALQKQDVPVLERRNLRLILAERNLQAGGLLSAESLSQAKLPAVDYFVSGNVTFPSASEFALTISIIRADRATVEATFTQHGNYPDDWLPVIEALAREVNTRLQLPKPEHPARSEFEMMTWLPEAALPFFKGLDYYSRGDYASAVPWFRDSYAKDQHFDIARHWEARAYQKLNLPQLAGAMAFGKTNQTPARSESHRPVVAVVTSDKISVAGRAAFLEALAQSGEFELFDPATIGATADELDLQLTGQMAAPLNNHSVWLVMDDLIYLDAVDAESLTARQQNLLSGEIVRRAKIRATGADEAGCVALAKAFLQNQKSSPAVSPENEIPQALPEPGRFEASATALPKALRLVRAEPDNARWWVGLADFYPDETRKLLLEKAVNIIETNRQSPDAAFWLASALWREREMTRRIFYIPTATRLAPNPLTNDFARLLQWFPKSSEAASLVEVTNHGEGSYTYVEPADRSYLAAVFTNLNIVSPLAKLSGKPATVPTVTDARRFTRLNECLRDGRNAPAWQLANELHQSGDPAVKAQVQPMFDRLLQTVVRERDQFQDFTAAVAAGNAQRIMDSGKNLLQCVNRRQRVEVLKQCGVVVKKENGAPAQLQFLFTQARQYRDDFLLEPVAGQPGDHVEYQLLDGTTNLVMRVVYGADYGYEPLMGNVADLAHDLPPSALTRDILNYIHTDPALPLAKRLTAAYDLALLEQAQGNHYEALEQLKVVLRQTEGTGLPLRRNNSWSQSIESAAFDALRKVRIYSGAEINLCDCCGKVPEEPSQKPANFDEVNAKLAQLWKQQIGEAGTNLPPIKAQLLAGKDDYFPAILYKLRTGQEVSHTLIFCADLGTNALPALPVILQIIQRGGPFQDYNNALGALGALGPAAGCAKPLLILARENADNGNFNYAFKRIGPAPRQVLPQLAQLLYHQDPEICKLAARAMIETAALELKQFKGLSEEQQVTAVRGWWEEAGAAQP